MLKLLLALLLLAAIELSTLVWLTDQLGGWVTLGLLLVGGMLGTALARRAGMRVFRDWQDALASGRPPASGALEGMLIFASAVLFLLPGVWTDVLGALLLAAPVRRVAAGWLRRWLRLEVSSFGSGRAAPRRPHASDVLDTEGEAVDDFDTERPGPRQLH
jgi:UPF0716 protein FxsA